MASKPSSLLDDVAFGDIGKSKEQKREGGESNPQKPKLIAVCLMLLTAGGILGWYYLWPEPLPPSAIPGNPAALNTAEQEAAKKQEKKVQEDMEKPELFHGPS